MKEELKKKGTALHRKGNEHLLRGGKVRVHLRPRENRGGFA